MASEGLAVEHLRAYLRDLQPQARALLVAEIERGAVCGAQIPGAALILEELRPVLRQAGQRLARVASPARLFFRPVEPFLVDRSAIRVPAGRMARSALQPLWDWISTLLLPAAVARFSEEVARSLGRDDGALAQATRRFQDEAARAIGAALDCAAADERAARRLAARIRTDRPLQAARTLQIVLAHQDALAHVAARLPPHIPSFDEGQVDSALRLLKGAGACESEALRQALILVADRLGVFWQLIRLAIRSAESDAAAKVAQSPFAPAVDMVLAEIRARVEALRELCKRGRFGEAPAPLKDIHDAIRAVRTEMDLLGDSAWGRELAAIRAAVSDLLRTELESTVGWVRRLLRPRGPGEVLAGAIDPGDVATVEGRIGLVAACRHFASELALNQVAPRVHAELQTYLDTSISTLIEALRHAEGVDRSFRQSQVEAAVRFAAKLFGAEYAALLARAAALAGLERPPARA